MLSNRARFIFSLITALLVLAVFWEITVLAGLNAAVLTAIFTITFILIWNDSKEE